MKNTCFNFGQEDDVAGRRMMAGNEAYLSMNPPSQSHTLKCALNSAIQGKTVKIFYLVKHKR